LRENDTLWGKEPTAGFLDEWSDAQKWAALENDNTGRKSQVENSSGLKNGGPVQTRTADLLRVKQAL
jgi:hypothetical protein